MALTSGATPHYFYPRVIRRMTGQLLDLFNNYWIIKYAQPSANVFVATSAIPVPIRFGPMDKVYEELKQTLEPESQVSQNPLHPLLTLPRLALTFDALNYDGARQQALHTPFPAYYAGPSGVAKTYMPIPVQFTYNLFAFAKTYDEIAQLYEQIYQVFYPVCQIAMPKEESMVSEETTNWPIYLAGTQTPMLNTGFTTSDNPIYEARFTMNVKGYMYKRSETASGRIFKVICDLHPSADYVAQDYDQIEVSAVASAISAITANPLCGVSGTFGLEQAIYHYTSGGSV